MVNHESITETHELRRPARLEIDNSLRDDCKLLLTPMASSDVTTTASQLWLFQRCQLGHMVLNRGSSRVKMLEVKHVSTFLNHFELTHACLFLRKSM